MKILNQVWNDMEVSTIARSWAKSDFLNPSMEADIRAKHGSRTKCIISIKTKDSLDSIVVALSRLSLPDNPSSNDNLIANIHGFADLHQMCSLDNLAVELEIWTQIEHTSDFVELVNQEKQESISKDACIEALHTETDSCSSDKEMEDELPGRTISELDVMGICSSLIDLQQLLEQHGVSAAAESVEKAGHDMMHASRMA